MNVPIKVESGEIIENVIIKGDLSRLDAAERAQYYVTVCKSVGLNPLTRPLEYITLQGKLTLYAKRDCADQLRKLHNVSLKVLEQRLDGDLLTVHVKATMPDGREDEDFGAVSLPETAKGEIRANLVLKAITKAKRRATLSICGLGFLDETEVADIPAHAKRIGIARSPMPHVDPDTGEIDESVNDTTDQAAPVNSPPSEAGAATVFSDERWGMAQAAAMRGRDALIAFARECTPAERKELAAHKAELERLYPKQ